MEIIWTIAIKYGYGKQQEQSANKAQANSHKNYGEEEQQKSRSNPILGEANTKRAREGTQQQARAASEARRARTELLTKFL